MFIFWPLLYLIAIDLIIEFNYNGFMQELECDIYVYSSKEACSCIDKLLLNPCSMLKWRMRVFS
jgi:hypothetical protein